MLSSKDCLKSINFAPRQKLSSGVLQIPGVIAQLSPNDQWSSPEAPALQVSIMRRLQVVSSPGMICLPVLLSSFNVTRIHPRASIEALLPQRGAITSLRQTDLTLNIRDNNPSILIIQITSVLVASGRPSANSWNFPSTNAFQLGLSRYSINHRITIRSQGVNSFDHIAIVTLIHSVESAVTSNMNRYTNGGGWIVSDTGHITPNRVSFM